MCRSLGQTGTHRIEWDVSNHLQQMGFILDRLRAKAALEQVTDALAVLIEPGGINTEELLHPRRQIGFWRANYEV